MVSVNSHVKADGYVISTSPEGTVEYDTYQCKHCGGHRKIEKDGGVGWCSQCNGKLCETCTRKGICTPFMKEIELQESRYYRRSQLARMLGVE